MSLSVMFRMSPSADCMNYILRPEQCYMWNYSLRVVTKKNIDQALQRASVMPAQITLHWHATNRLANYQLCKALNVSPFSFQRKSNTISVHLHRKRHGLQLHLMHRKTRISQNILYS